MPRSIALATAALACLLLALAPTASAAAKPATAVASARPVAVAGGGSGGGGGQRGELRSGTPLAPATVCPNQTEAEAAPATQVAAMLCMTNFARTAYGLAPLAEAKPLVRAAARKSADILTCDQFSHEACGRQFTYWMSRYGYLRGCWSAGENIAWGTGTLGTVRGIFNAWMHSPGHRENILGPYAEIGISYTAGTLEGNAGAVVWTQDFGAHTC
jgi:uncharacterized protein YkwD